MQGILVTIPYNSQVIIVNPMKGGTICRQEDRGSYYINQPLKFTKQEAKLFIKEYNDNPKGTLLKYAVSLENPVVQLSPQFIVDSLLGISIEKERKSA